MDLLPTFLRITRRYSSAATWVLSSEIRLQAGCASAGRLTLLGFYKMALSRQRLAFMCTTQADALAGLARTRPGLLIVTNQLEQGSGLELVAAARDLVDDIRTILIVDPRLDDLVAAGRSSADAVLAETDLFTAARPVVAMARSLSIGQRFRSAAVLAAMERAAVQRQSWRDAPPQLTPPSWRWWTFWCRASAIGRWPTSWASATKVPAASASRCAGSSVSAAGARRWPGSCSLAWPV